jgi:hypothetical protein
LNDFIPALNYKRGSEKKKLYSAVDPGGGLSYGNWFSIRKNGRGK